MMQATIPVPMIVPTLWALALATLVLFGTMYVWAMIKEKEVIKRIEEASYGN
jgi:hypothetical protein